MLLTTRSKALRTHAGQTALPGGKTDDTDKDLIETAVSAPLLHLASTDDDVVPRSPRRSRSSALLARHSHSVYTGTVLVFAQTRGHACCGVSG